MERKCEKCGNILSDDANFCPVCQEKVSDEIQNQNEETTPIDETQDIDVKACEQESISEEPEKQAQSFNQFSQNQIIPETNKVVSTGRWIGRMFIPWIPFVGPLVYLIMLIVWAVSDDFEKTSKNWAIASIIMCIIKIIVSIIVTTIIANILREILNDPQVQRELYQLLKPLY